MNDVNCPYCNAEIEICHDDGFGYDEGILHEYECNACDNYFVFTTDIIIKHYAKKADCLNDGNHIYEETKTYPKRYSKLRCKTCGDEKPLPKERLEEILKLEGDKE